MIENRILKFGCFLTGFNYQLLNTCSEAAKGKIKQYLAGLFIISILWFLVGFSFAHRYLDVSTFASIATACILAFIVIQIERQIILANSSNKVVVGFRVTLAIVMSIIGSLILDQIIYSDDLDKRKTMIVGEEATKITTSQSKQLENRKNELEIQLQEQKSKEQVLTDELNKNPLINVISESTTRKQIPKDIDKEQLNKDVNLLPVTQTNRTQITNPAFEDKKRISQQIALINNKINEIEDEKINLYETIKKEQKENRGFLDELSLMIGILRDSRIALIVYILVFIFLLSLELLVVFTKVYGQKTDLEKLLEYQIHTRILTINNMTKELDQSIQSQK